MGQKCPKNCKNCIKIVENARFSCKTPKIWRYFCVFLPLDNKCGKWYNWPAEHGGAGRNFVNSKTSQIFHLIFRIFCEFCTIPETHGPCKTPYAPYPIAGRKRQCGPEFPLTRPYANFFITNVARARNHEIPENPIWPVHV